MKTQSKPHQEISKAVLERIIIGVIVAGAVIYGSWKLLIAPMKAQRETVRKENELVTGTLKANQALVAAKGKTAADYEEMRKKIMNTMTDAMPPSVNAQAWVGDFFRKLSTAPAGLRPLRIQETGTMTMPVKEGQLPLFEEYNVRADYLSDYHAFGRYLAALESTNSLMRVDGFEISTGLKFGEKAYEMLPNAISLRTTFLRFTDVGFPAEERPDAPVPRVIPKETLSKTEGGGQAGSE